MTPSAHPRIQSAQTADQKLCVCVCAADIHRFLTDHQHTASGEVTFMEMRKKTGRQISTHTEHSVCVDILVYHGVCIRVNRFHLDMKICQTSFLLWVGLRSGASQQAAQQLNS